MATPLATGGVIEGKVLMAATGEPLRGARVALELEGAGLEGQASEDRTTSQSGTFSFTRLKPGSYRLTVRRSGYITQEYGEPPGARGRGRGTPISVVPSTLMRDLVFRMEVAAVITGRVIDDQGDPMAEVHVEVSEAAKAGAQRMLVPVASGKTDDRGEYRIFGLRRGSYIVSASPQQQERFFLGARTVSAGAAPSGAETHTAPVRTFYPSATELNGANTVELGAGQELSGIDIRVVPVQVFTIRGKVQRASEAKGLVQLMLFDKEQVSGFTGGGRAMAAADGTFEIANVKPGTYRLMAMAIDMEGGFGGAMNAQVEVVVGGADVNDLNVILGGGADISGALKVAGESKALPRFSMVMLIPEDSGEGFRGATAMVKEDGSFTMKGVTAGTYQVMANAGTSSEHYVKEVRLGGRDVRRALEVPASGAMSGLEITLGTDGGVLAGRVLNKENLPASGARVLLVPAQEKPNPMETKYAQADQSGQFEIKGIRPGEYRVMALEGDSELRGLTATQGNGLAEYSKKGKAVQVPAGARVTTEVQILADDKP